MVKVDLVVVPGHLHPTVLLCLEPATIEYALQSLGMVEELVPAPTDPEVEIHAGGGHGITALGAKGPLVDREGKTRTQTTVYSETCGGNLLQQSILCKKNISKRAPNCCNIPCSCNR